MTDASATADATAAAFQMKTSATRTRGRTRYALKFRSGSIADALQCGCIIDCHRQSKKVTSLNRLRLNRGFHRCFS